MIHCGNCREESIPSRVGIFRCDKCGQGHSIHKMGSFLIVDPLPNTEKEGELENANS